MSSYRNIMERTCYSLMSALLLTNILCCMFIVLANAGLTYRLDRLKSRASKFRGPPANVCIILNTVIGLSHLCCHNVMYFLNNPSVIFLTQLHSIAEF
jgi:fumarate reductase subunit C